MARVKPKELAAMLNIVQERINQQAATIFKQNGYASHPESSFDFNRLYGDVNERRVIKIAVALAKAYSKAGELTDIQKLILGSETDAKNFSSAIRNLEQVLNNSVNSFDAKSVKMIISNLELAESLNKSIEEIKKKAKDAIKEDAPAACAILDGLLVVALQSVPFVGNVLSGFAKDGVWGTVLSAAGKMSSGAIDNLRDPEVSKGKNDIKWMGFEPGGGLHVTGATNKLELRNDFELQLASAMAAKGVDIIKTLGSDAVKKISSDVLTTSLNVSLLYKTISNSMKVKYNFKVNAVANDKEFFNALLAHSGAHFMHRGPTTQNYTSADFQNRGMSAKSIVDAVSDVHSSFVKPSGNAENAIDTFLSSFEKKIKSYKALVEACVTLNVTLSLKPAIKAFNEMGGSTIGDSIYQGSGTEGYSGERADRHVAATIIMAMYLEKRIAKNTDFKNTLKQKHNDIIEAEKKKIPVDQIDKELLGALIGQGTGNVFAERRNSVSFSSGNSDELTRNRRHSTDLNESLFEKESAAERKIIEDKQSIAASLNKIGFNNDIAKAKAAKNRNLIADATTATLNPIAYGRGRIDWGDIQTQSENYISTLKNATKEEIGALFPNPKISGIQDALKALVASAIIINDVHSAMATNSTIHINPGAVALLADCVAYPDAVPPRPFVKTYVKVLMKTQKEKLHLESDVHIKGNTATILHSLRFPTGLVEASKQELTRLYIFATLVVAYADVGAITIGFADWAIIRQFLNTAIKEINSACNDIKDDDYNEEFDKLKGFNAELKKNAAAAAERAEDKRVKAAREKFSNNDMRKDVRKHNESEMIKGNKIDDKFIVDSEPKKPNIFRRIFTTKPKTP